MVQVLDTFIALAIRRIINIIIIVIIHNYHFALGEFDALRKMNLGQIMCKVEYGTSKNRPKVRKTR